MYTYLFIFMLYLYLYLYLYFYLYLYIYISYNIIYIYKYIYMYIYIYSVIWPRDMVQEWDWRRGGSEVWGCRAAAFVFEGRGAACSARNWLSRFRVTKLMEDTGTTGHWKALFWFFSSLFRGSAVQNLREASQTNTGCCNVAGQLCRYVIVAAVKKALLKDEFQAGLLEEAAGAL